MWGEEPGDLFLHPNDAALDFAMNYNQKSIDEDVEYGTAIVEKIIGGQTFYTYTDVINSNPPIHRDGGTQYFLVIPKQENQVGEIHTHEGTVRNREGRA